MLLRQRIVPPASTVAGYQRITNKIGKNVTNPYFTDQNIQIIAIKTNTKLNFIVSNCVSCIPSLIAIDTGGPPVSVDIWAFSKDICLSLISAIWSIVFTTIAVSSMFTYGILT